MEIGKACIYCGTTKDLSDSDIIPDALTNAKIINPNVCRIAHNNRFSDMFEDYIIKELAIFTNELDIKSSKGKKYAAYDASFVIDDTAYATKISSETDLFHKSKIISTPDGKTKLGSLAQIQKIKGATGDSIKIVDINQIEIETRVILKMTPFFSMEMYRLMTKIAFEWYCLHNDVCGKLSEFENIIKFITTGNGTNPVGFVSNPDVYALLDQTVAFGSHTLLSYISTDGSVNIMISLFGISAYNVRILDRPIENCKKNAMFQVLTIDAKRNQFFYNSVEDLETDFYESFSEVLLPNGMKVKIPKNMKDMSLEYKCLYILNYQLFQKALGCITEPTMDAVELLKNQMENLLQVSAFTIRGIKRFAKEQGEYLVQGTALNPRGTNKKSVFLFYCLFIVGQHDDVKTFNDLNSYIKEKFHNDTVCINEEINQEFLKEIFSDKDYFASIKRGAEIVKLWEYD